MMFRRTLIAATVASLGVSAAQTNVVAEEKASLPQLSPLAKPASAVVRSVSQEQKTAATRLLILAQPQSGESATEKTTQDKPKIAAAPVAASRLSTGATAPTTISPSKAVKEKVQVKVATNYSKTLGATSPLVVEQTQVPVVAKVEVKKVEAKPAAPAKTVAAAPVKKTPARLASREAHARQLMLARLDADLMKAEKRLARAESHLTSGQRSLQSVVGVLETVISEAGTDARGLHPFVRVGQRYLGTPYVWGGESARGFDCSGFIMRVMRDLGYKALPHSAAEQFRYGAPVARGLLRPGDLVFFANTYKPGISHVGIYVGRNRFIHAANSQDGTIISSLNSPKWLEKYAGARRLIAH